MIPVNVVIFKVVVGAAALSKLSAPAVPYGSGREVDITRRCCDYDLGRCGDVTRVGRQTQSEHSKGGGSIFGTANLSCDVIYCFYSTPTVHKVGIGLLTFDQLVINSQNAHLGGD